MRLDLSPDMRQSLSLGKWLAAQKGNAFKTRFREDSRDQRIGLHKTSARVSPSLRDPTSDAVNGTTLNLNAGSRARSFYVRAGRELENSKFHFNRSRGHRYA